MNRTLGFACALAMLMPGTATAREPVRLAPSSSWLLDYATERCTLVRDFGEGDRSVQLRIESFGSWREFRLTLIGRPVARSGRSTDEISYRFSPDQDDRKAHAIIGLVGDQPALSFSASFGAREPDTTLLPRGERERLAAIPKSPEPAFERAVSSLRVEPRNGKDVELQLGSMADPLKAVRDCVDDLQKSWGLDPVVQRERSRLPVIKIDTVRDVQRRYPTTMLVGEKTAFVPVRVMIDGGGQATSCVIQAVGIPKAFTEAVCEGLMGLYVPALDKGGNPIPTVYHTSVIYMLG